MAIRCRETGCTPNHKEKIGCGHKLYTRFKYKNKEYKECTGKVNYREAEQFEWDLRAKAEQEAYDRKFHPERLNDRASEPIPLFSEFARLPKKDGSDEGGRFWCDLGNKRYKKANTLSFYRARTKALLDFPPVANCRLDQINEAVIDKYVNLHLGELGPGTINQNIGHLEFLLRKAKRWGIITVLPEFPGRGERLEVPERGREISKPEEDAYFSALAAAGPDFRDMYDLAGMCIDTGIEPGQVICSLMQWSDIHLGRIGKLKYGYIHDPFTKRPSRNRDVPIPTKRLYLLLRDRWERFGKPTSGLVWPSRSGHLHRPLSYAALTKQHRRFAKGKFRPYDFRHTFLTRAGESGVSDRTLQAFGGWTNLKMAWKYCHRSAHQKAIGALQYEEFIEDMGRLCDDAPPLAAD